MAIKRDLSDLPEKPEGNDFPGVRPAPKLVNAIGHSLGVLHDRREAQRDMSHGPDVRFRASDAGKCIRALALREQGHEPEPFGVQTTWVFDIGHAGHDLAQKALTDALVDQDVNVEHEVRHHLHLSSGTVGCTLDTLVTEPKRIYNIEIKTVGGYKFKLVTIGMRGRIEAPSYEHRLQAVMGGQAAGVDDTYLVYLAKENISNNIAADRGIEGAGQFMAAWHLDGDLASDMVDKEEERLLMLDNGAPPVVYDDKGVFMEVVNPVEGTTVYLNDRNRTARTWRCDYCEFRSTCTATWKES